MDEGCRGQFAVRGGPVQQKINSANSETNIDGGEPNKMNRVKKVPATIAAATAYAACYQLTPFVGVSTGVIIALWMLSPFVVCYMAYVILKYGKPWPHTFEEKFYDDLDYWRNGKAPVS